MYEGQLNRPAGMPNPNSEGVDRGLWKAAAEGRLDIQQCSSCNAHRNPPSEGCIHCGSTDWTWSTVQGTGTIMTYVWIPDPARGAVSSLPSQLYNLAVVELDGTQGPPSRIMTNIVDAWNPGDIEVGQRVELHCIRVSDEVGLPCFVRSKEDEGYGKLA